MTSDFRECVEPRSIDPYPSRQGEELGVLLRRDPVVYSGSTSASPISGPLVKQYSENGFLVLKNIIPARELVSLQHELTLLRKRFRKENGAYISEPGVAADSLRSVFAIHQSSEEFSRLSRARRLVDIACYLLNDDVYVHQSRLNCKPAFVGRGFQWHSDFETWHAEDGMPRMRAVSISIALTRNDSRNGALMLIPGSHRYFVTCSGTTPENHYRESLREQQHGIPSNRHIADLVQQGGIETADLSPGDALVFDCNLLHGSCDNITPWARSNAFFVYNAISNGVVEPFCGRTPRPEHICTRRCIRPIKTISGGIG